MKATEINSRLTEVLRDSFGHPERSEGLHASQVIRDLSVQIGRGKSGMAQDKLEEFGTMGFVWERVIETTLAQLTVDSDPGRYMRIGEQQQDGIYRTTDYVDLDFLGDGTYQLGIEEWKCRWHSYRKGDDLEKNYWEFLTQIKDYCGVLGTRLARLRILYIAGDWKGDICPRLRTWELEFTDRELQDTREMLVGHAKRKGWL